MTLPALATLIIATRTRTVTPPPARPWWHETAVLTNVALAVLLALGTYAWYSINWANARAHADTTTAAATARLGIWQSKLSWRLPHFDQAVFLSEADRVVGALNRYRDLRAPWADVAMLSP